MCVLFAKLSFWMYQSGLLCTQSEHRLKC